MGRGRLIRKRLSTAKQCGGTNLPAAFRARPSHTDLLLAQVHSDSLRFAQIRLVSSELYRFTHSHPDSHKLFQTHADFCSPTQNRTLSFRFTQMNLDSPHPLQILSISFRFRQSRLAPFQSTLSRLDSLSLTQIYFTSLRFTELRFRSGSDHMQNLSGPLILAQIHSDLFRVSQIRSFPSSITPDSDQFRSSQIHYSFSSRFTQTHTALPILVPCHFDFLRFAQPRSDSHQFRSSHIPSFSFRLTQAHQDVLRLLQSLEIPFDFFILRQIR